MKGSLQEQLLKSGLISEDRLSTAKKPRKKPNKKKRSTVAKQTQHGAINNTPAPAELKKQKELRAEVKKLLRSHKINNKSGEIAYNYTINNQVKRFFVTEEQQKSLIDGVLAIANWNGISYLIPNSAVEELRSLYPKISICISESQKSDVDKNDPYAEYVIPDDMKW